MEDQILQMFFKEFDIDPNKFENFVNSVQNQESSEIENLKAQIKEKDLLINELKQANEIMSSRISNATYELTKNI